MNREPDAASPVLPATMTAWRQTHYGGPETVSAGTVHPMLAILFVVLYHAFQLPLGERLRERAAALPVAGSA